MSARTIPRNADAKKEKEPCSGRGHDMEIITQRHAGETAELKIRGRLDGYRADHLATELSKVVREGTHRLWLDLSGVMYLSSLGVGVLVRYQNQLKSLGGSLKVVHPSEPVKDVLETFAGLNCW